MNQQQGRLLVTVSHSCFSGFIACLGLLLGLSLAQSQSETNRVLVVSRPAAPVLPSDPPLGVIYDLPTDLSTATPLYQASDIPASFDYLRLSRDGTGFLSFGGNSKDGTLGGILTVADFLAQNNKLNASNTTMITGETVGLVDPKGLVLDEAQGLVITADFETGAIKGFDINAEGDVAATFTFTDLGSTEDGTPRKPWGIDLGPVNGHLFVAVTDGTILVYDNYFMHRDGDGPDRVIVPTLSGQKISANLHGVFYDATRDNLIVTDFGAAKNSDEAGFDSDGKLFILEKASTANGHTEVSLQVSGVSSSLGNPADVVAVDDRIYVAEKALDVVLRFDNLFMQTGALELAPSAAVSVPKPESIVVLPAQP
jgi:hypothetical protein